MFSSQAELSNTSSVTDSTSEDLTSSSKEQSPPLVSELLFIQRMVEVFNVLLFSDDDSSATEEKKKVKKKNCFQRLGSWMRNGMR